jgi:geranylgeranyl pyrophosphate synthase
MEAATESDKVLLDETLHGQSSDKIERVMALFQKYNIADKTRKLVEEYSQEAVQHLHKIEVDQQKKQSLVSLTDFLLNRQH